MKSVAVYHEIPYVVFFINEGEVYNQGPISTSISYSVSSYKNKFVFVYQDHFTKCVVLRPLEPEGRESACQHVDIFLLFGSLCVLQSDNGRCIPNGGDGILM